MRSNWRWCTLVGVAFSLTGQVWAGEAESKSNPIANGSIITDGSFLDWAGVTPFTADPAGDAIGKQDWQQLWMAHDDTFIYLRLERAPGSVAFNDVYRIALDTDQNPASGATTSGAVPLPIGAEYITNGTSSISFYMPGACEAPGLGYASGWAGQIRICMEGRILRSDLGDPADFNFACLARVSGDQYPDNFNANYFNYTTGTVPDPLPAGTVASLSNPIPDGSIVIDHAMADWAGITPFPVDTLGDSSGTGGDWAQIWIAHDSTYFYFRLDRTVTCTTLFTGADGYTWFLALDTDKDPATPAGGRIGSVGADYLISGDREIYRLSDWAVFSWVDAEIENYEGEGTVSYEGRMPRASFGNPTDFNFACYGYRSYDWYPGTASEYFHYTTGMPISPLETGMMASLSNPVTPGTITINGNMDDWASITPFPADAPNDNNGAEDWTQVWIAHDDTYFYFRGQRSLNATPFGGGDGWYWYLMLDTDRNGTTGAVFGCIGMEYLIPGTYEAYKFETNGSFSAANPWPWDAMSGEIWDAAPTAVELKIRRAEIGDPAAINVVLIGQDQPDIYPDGGNDWFKYEVHDPLPPIVDVATRSNRVAPGAITLDGNTDDWVGIESYPADALESLQYQNWEKITVAHDDTNVYLLVEASGLPLVSDYGWGFWLVLDTDMNSATGWKGEIQRPFAVGGEFELSGGFGIWARDAGGCWLGLPVPSTIGISPDGFKAEYAIARTDLGLTNPTSSFRFIAVTQMSYDYMPEGGDVNAAFRYDFLVCNTPSVDVDGDGDVDQEDFGEFQACYTGSIFSGLLSGVCACLDQQGGSPDGVIDGTDYAAFLNCWSGPGIASTCP